MFSLMRNFDLYDIAMNMIHIDENNVAHYGQSPKGIMLAEFDEKLKQINDIYSIDAALVLKEIYDKKAYDEHYTSMTQYFKRRWKANIAIMSVALSGVEIYNELIKDEVIKNNVNILSQKIMNLHKLSVEFNLETQIKPAIRAIVKQLNRPVNSITYHDVKRHIVKYINPTLEESKEPTYTSTNIDEETSIKLKDSKSNMNTLQELEAKLEKINDFHSTDAALILKEISDRDLYYEQYVSMNAYYKNRWKLNPGLLTVALHGASAYNELIKDELIRDNIGALKPQIRNLYKLQMKFDIEKEIKPAIVELIKDGDPKDKHFIGYAAVKDYIGSYLSANCEDKSNENMSTEDSISEELIYTPTNIDEETPAKIKEPEIIMDTRIQVTDKDLFSDSLLAVHLYQDEFDSDKLKETFTVEEIHNIFRGLHKTQENIRKTMGWKEYLKEDTKVDVPTTPQHSLDHNFEVLQVMQEVEEANPEKFAWKYVPPKGVVNLIEESDGVRYITFLVSLTANIQLGFSDYLIKVKCPEDALTTTDDFSMGPESPDKLGMLKPWTIHGKSYMYTRIYRPDTDKRQLSTSLPDFNVVLIPADVILNALNIHLDDPA